MIEENALEVGELVDGQTIRPSAIIFLVIATLVLIGDGFDLAAVGFVAPELVKQWHVAPSALGPVFSAGIFGLLFGAPLLGYVGDRLGRKKAILVGLCTFGIFTLVSMAATSLGQFVVLRFLTGIGLGGVIPNVIALTAEVAPKRLRGTFIIITNFGVPAGIALPGGVAALLVPEYGWQVLFLVGGVLPLVVALLVWSLLPESIKFLVQQGNRQDDVRRLARKLRPDLRIDSRTRFSIARVGEGGSGASPKKLFADGLAIITPVLWVALAANQMANFFVLSWLPTLLQSAGSTTAQAGVSASMFSIGGMFGGLILTFILDRFGVVPIFALFLIGAPLVAAMGVPGLTPTVLGVIIAGAGFCVVGVNFGLNAAMGMIYPTRIRSIGAGWSQAVGRLGSVAGPLIGGILLGMHLPTQELFFAPTISLAAGAIACAILALLCVRRFGGLRLDESSAVSGSASVPIVGEKPVAEFQSRTAG